MTTCGRLRKRGLLVAIASLVFAFAIPAGAESGNVTVTPGLGVAGDYGTWVVTVRVGRGGIARGGGVRVQLPDAWHAGERNSANPLQASDPAADHYVSARVSRDKVRLRTRVEEEADRVLIKHEKQGLDGRSERYVFVVRVEVTQGRLRRGDTLSVVYGDTSGGSRGLRAAIISTEPEPVLVAVDREGSGDFRLLPDRPTLQSRSGSPAILDVTTASQAQVGQPGKIRVAILDRHSNPVSGFRDRFQVRLLQGQARVESEVELDLKEGWAQIPWTPLTQGIFRIEVSTLGGTLKARMNPVKALPTLPDRNLYWGDLHSHTEYSWDGVGNRSFHYARSIAGLDFYSMTDHSRTSANGFTRGLGPHVWEEYTALAEAHNVPGEFATLHGYEASFKAPYGHHNVYFRDMPGPLLSPETITLPQLWERLEAGTALTIPHHTAKFPNPVSWDHHDPELRRNFELYSGHGSSEAYDPDHPLAFEQSDFTSPSSSIRGAQSAQHAWMHGLVLSTVAASDDHRAQPGKPHWGLTAVSASDLTRESVFDALYQRRTYGTTGARILLEFSVNGHPMGQSVESGEPPRLSIEAHGTDLIEEVEVLRYSEGDDAFRVVQSLHPHTLDFTWTDQDHSFHDDSIYYVRLRQRGTIRNRIVMAWSSPIWVGAVER